MPEDEKVKGITIFKAHHSFCDGVSIMCLTLALGEDYGRHYFVSSKDAKWYEALFVRLTSVFQIPAILKRTILARQD